MGFSAHPLYGGGARVVAALEDGTRVELPVGELNVAEADETATRLEARLRDGTVEGRYR